MDYQGAIEVIQDIHDVAEVRIKSGDVRGVVYINPNRLTDLKDAINAMQELQQYKQLGTLGEVREAVEKQQDKKIEIWNGQAMCPKCNALFGNMDDIKKLIAWEMPNCKFLWTEIRLEHCNPYGKPDFDYDTSMKIIDFIENYQTKVGEWIPCSERLPELNKKDLDSEGEYFMISDPVIVTDGKNIGVSQYEIDDAEDKGWLYNGCLEDADVIAWMPLPEPYIPNVDTVKPTNADRIRSMTDEELGVFLRKVKADYQWSDPEFPDVDDDWTEWLQSEAEE